jgi:hypothetical protein
MLAPNTEEPDLGEVPCGANVGRKHKSKDVNYDAAVTEAKRILAQAESGRMRLGELADGVEKQYGAKRLKKFAADIGIAACTLERCRSVFRAWQTNNKKALAPISYSVAQELQAHPNRFELIKQNPNMTKSEARKIRLSKDTEAAKPADHPQCENFRRWFQDVVKRAGEALRHAEMREASIDSPELRQAWRDGIEPALLPTLRKAGEGYIQLADYLEQLLEEPCEMLQAAE